MATLTFSYRREGPVLEVRIGVSLAHREALERAGLPVPQAGEFLIDTGASISCVDASLINRLGLNPTGEQDVHTPTTDRDGQKLPTFDVAFEICGHKDSAPTLLVEDTEVFATRFEGQTIHGLIGQDILSRCVFIADGASRLAILAW